MTEKEKQLFVFCGDRLLLEKNEAGAHSVPTTELLAGNWKSDQLQPTDPGFALDLKEEDAALQSLLQGEQYRLVPLRQSYDLIEKEAYTLAGRAKEILFFQANSQFCPACGTPTERKLPTMRKCPHCSKELYPPIAPAVVIRITRGDEILLVRSKSIRYNIVGFVAGFLEAGETLEECVAREVMEEVGLKVKNIRYFGSQPWPYPCGVMMGFTSEYESGEIRLQEEELAHATFHHKDHLPENIPPRLSLARMMIDEWRGE